MPAYPFESLPMMPVHTARRADNGPPAIAGNDSADELKLAMERAERAFAAKHFGEAAGICDDVLARHPDHQQALAIRGTILSEQGRFEEAIPPLLRACATTPSVAAWHNILIRALRLTHRLDDALAAARTALKLSPERPSLLFSLGKVHMDRGETDAAMDLFLEVLARDPESAEAHLSIGQILLARGEMRPGWREYEWNRRLEHAKPVMPEMTRPEWNGMRLPGKRILLVADQGYGDVLQFVRYAPLVAPFCEQIVVACAPELSSLISRMPGVGVAASRWSDVPTHAAWCRLSSLPQIFDTTPDTIPCGQFYLSPDPALVETWARRLDERLGTRRPRVGLVWQGRTSHPNDARRSLRLAALTSILSVPDTSFVSLQRPVPAHDTTLVRQARLLDLAEELTDFDVTAAIMTNLDLVITVDSAVAHLAGALGVPAWVLLGNPSDWRWMLEREDSPWYPSVRLFRQSHPGAWQPPIDRAASALQSFKAMRTAHRIPRSALEA
jgi:Flp pilus assembly protein TadD